MSTLGDPATRGPLVVKPYVTRAELAALVGGWSQRTISRLIQKRVLREREHFFLDPCGRGYLFRWDRIVDVIESGVGDAAAASDEGDNVPMLAGGFLGDGRKSNPHGL